MGGGQNQTLLRAGHAHVRVSYWREEPVEVDGILEGSWGQWAIEVKTGRFQMSELAGLLEFTRRHPGFQPLVICSASGRATAERADVPAVTWQQFLLDGPPSTTLRA